MSRQSTLDKVVIKTEVAPATPRRVRYAAAKRVVDLVVGFALLVLLTPLFLVIALLVKLTSRGPVFYVSDRVGLGGKTIRFVKFRTMCEDADEKLEELLEQNEKDGPIFKIRHDPRITPVGRFLRKYSLDELPQLFSVISGEMSLVGPRPQLVREVAHYDDRTRQRLTVKPGITCYWQVMGRSELSYEEWIDLDLCYIEEMSFWLDLQIILKTPLAVLRGHGAY